VSTGKYAQSDFYMYTANAVDPSYIYEEEQQIVREKPVQKKQRSSVSRAAIKGTVVFVLAILVVSQYVFIQGLGYSITQKEVELNSIVTANEKLKKEYSSLGELAMVEEYAINTLGMVKADTTMNYVATEQVAVQLEESAQGESYSLGNFVNRVLGVLNFN